MTVSRTAASRLTRTLLVAAVAAAPVVALASPASAMANVTRADYSAGTLHIAGNAIWDRTITVDGVAVGTTTSATGGIFDISVTGYTPPADCTVDVNDGSANATTVLLKGCTPTAATAAILPDRTDVGPFQVGVPVSSRTVSFAGSIGPDSWQIVSGALPAGLTMTVPQPTALPRPNTPEQLTYALITGTPTKAGTSTVTFRATDVRGLTATRTYTITVNPSVPVAITPQPWSSLTVGTSVNLWIDGSGGLRPYRWAVVGGALPPGMALVQDAVDGPSVRVGGTPTTAGTFTWDLRLTDVQGATTTRSFTTAVSQPSPPAEPTPTPTPTPAPTPEPAPVFISVSSLGLSPSTVAGGTATTGTVTISTAAPSGGTSVILASSDPQVASVPPTVTVPAGATRATFPITTTAVPFTRSATIDATYAGTLQAKLTVTAPVVTNADTVSIGRAEYDTAKRQLRVEATSSGSDAVLRVYVTGTDTLIGTLSAGSGQFTVAVNPVDVTVRSSLGGTAARPVTVK